MQNCVVVTKITFTLTRQLNLYLYLPGEQREEQDIASFRVTLKPVVVLYCSLQFLTLFALLLDDNGIFYFNYFHCSVLENAFSFLLLYPSHHFTYGFFLAKLNYQLVSPQKHHSLHKHYFE